MRFKPIVKVERVGRLWYATGRPGPKAQTVYQTGGYPRKSQALAALRLLMEGLVGGPAEYRQYSPGWVTVK